QHACFLLFRPSPVASQSAQIVVEQCDDCRTIPERPRVSNPAASSMSKGVLMERPADAAASEGATRPGGLPAHGATVAFIVERLRDDILAGRLAPGSRLVECELTARFSVSRGPVREALRRLAAEGLIEHLPHRGALVRRLTLREIRELFEIRVEMEALAARLAAAAESPERRQRFVAVIAPIY